MRSFDMKIKKAKWMDDENKTLRVEDDDGTVWFVPNANEGQYAHVLKEYIVANVIDKAPAKEKPEHTLDNLDVHIKALGLVLAQWCGKTPGQLKTAYKDALDTLKGN
jgi:hypothetical protein